MTMHNTTEGRDERLNAMVTGDIEDAILAAKLAQSTTTDSLVRIALGAAIEQLNTARKELMP